LHVRTKKLKTYSKKRITSVDTPPLMVRNIIIVKTTCFGIAFTATIMPVIIAATLAVLALNRGLITSGRV